MATKQKKQDRSLKIAMIGTIMTPIVGAIATVNEYRGIEASSGVYITIIIGFIMIMYGSFNYIRLE